MKLIIRGLFKSKFYTFVTMIGFGTALTLGALSTSFYVHETQTDNFVSPSVSRVLMSHPITYTRQAITFHELPSALKSDFPEVKTVTHLFYPGYLSVVPDNTGDVYTFKEKGVLVADEYFLEVFPFRLMHGDVKCLSQTNAAVLTAEYAVKYFGTTDALNRTLTISGRDFIVKGVLARELGKSHLKLTVLLSYSTFSAPRESLEYGGFTYVQLSEGSSCSDFQTKLNKNKSQLLSFKPAQWPDDPFRVEPIREVYYHEGYETHLEEIFYHRDRNKLSQYLIVSVIIFIVAIINFIIYFYSRNVTNSKQLLVQRILGASERSIIFGFITEAFVIQFISLSLGLLLASLLLPLFNDWAQSTMSVYSLYDFQAIAIMVLSVTVTSVFVGVMMYLILFKVKANVNISSAIATGGPKLTALKTLMVVQLTFSLTVIISFFMIRDQLRLIADYWIGYEKNALIEIDLSTFSADYNPQTIKQEYLKLSDVEAATLCFGGPLTGRWSRNISFSGKSANFGYYQVDSDFLSTLGIPLVAGENFKPLVSNDSSYLLINEAAADFFEIGYNMDTVRNDLPVPGKILGVHRNFHYSSLKETIGPSFLSYVPFDKVGPYGARIILRLRSINPQTLSAIENKWRGLATGRPFEYTIIADSYEALIRDDTNVSKLLSLVVGGLIFVTCFGIAGCTYFAAQKRSKETAIRKALGATVSELYGAWVKDLLGPIIVASAIAIPLSYYLILRWSSSFVYKQPIPPGSVFFGIMILVLAMVISSYYNIRKVVLANTVEVLKHE